MFSKELNNVLDSYRATFSGRQIVQFWKKFKIGGREYSFSLWFNHPHFGSNITVSSRSYGKKQFRLLEISFRPENKFDISYHSQYYPGYGIPCSMTELKLGTDDHIMNCLEWNSEMLENFISQLKLFLIEQL